MACRGFLQCLLKLFNLALALVGVLLLVYSLSLLVRELPSSPPSPVSPPSPPYPALSPVTTHLELTAEAAERSTGTGTLPPIDQHEHAHLAALSADAELPSLSSSFRSLDQMLRVSVPDIKLPDLWFTYFLIGAGSYISLLTLIGAVAAESNSSCCLSTYQFGLCFLLLGQAVCAALIFLHDVPDDPTGEYEKRRQFVEANMELCKLAAMCLLLVEGTALLLAMMLRAFQADEASAGDEEDEYLLAPPHRTPAHHQRRLSFPQAAPLLGTGHQYGVDPGELPYGGGGEQRPCINEAAQAHGGANDNSGKVCAVM